MENQQNTDSIIFSSTRTADYGTTSLSDQSTDINGNNYNRDNDDSTNNSLGYQSLPVTYQSTGNLINRGSSSSHIRHSPQGSFLVLSPSGGHRRPRMTTIDPLHNSEFRQISQRIEFFLNIVNQICIGFVTIYMSWLCLHNNLAGTALHAWLVTIGFTFLMAEAIMCHYNGNVLTYNYKRNTKTTIHWVLQTLGGGLGVAGTLIKCIQKGFLLTSTHGKLGFATFIFCLVSMLTGLSALYSMRIKNVINPLLNKSFHNLLGLVTFVLAMLAQFYGYQTGFFMRKTNSDFQIMIKCITLCVMVLSCIGPIRAMYHKTRNIIKNFA